jgi:ABC-type ATPase involved in cell division
VIQYLRAGFRSGDRRLLDAFDLAIGAGEAAWISGPPGGPQGRLVRMVAGLVAPSEGTVLVDDLNPARLDFRGLQAFRRGQGLVLDDEPPSGVDTASWIALGAHVSGRPWEESYRAALAELEAAGMKALGYERHALIPRDCRFPVALMRALLRRPRNLAVDWPGGLDGAVPEALLVSLKAFLTGGGSAAFTGGLGEWGTAMGGRAVTVEIPGVGA